jgi:hypothetical protein
MNFSDSQKQIDHIGERELFQFTYNVILKESIQIFDLGIACTTAHSKTRGVRFDHG